jgi:hypothetical protein
MKKLKPIPILATTAAIANALTVMLFFYASGEPGGSGMTMEFTVLWMPAIWLISIIIGLTVAIVYRKMLFMRASLGWTLLLLFFCTPVPFSVLAAVFLHKDNYCAETDYITREGYVLKHEEWVYNSGKIAVNKYYKLVNQNEDTGDDAEFPKDSVWTYFNRGGDTVKVEHYDKGRLLSSTQKSKRK